MNPPATSPSKDEIRAKLAARRAEPYITPAGERFSSGEPSPAAVLIPMLQNGNAWELLFVRRTTVDGDPHSGQVAFPGGRKDPEDPDLVHTALREAQEEIDLKPEDVQVLGNLEHMVTISNYELTPVVGVMPWPVELRPAPKEVERIFTIPLSWLADATHHEFRQREGPRGGLHPVIYFDEYDGELLWGVTARITLHFLQALELLPSE